MKFAFFLGCNIPERLEQYEESARKVLSELGVDLADISEFNCCGYPLRNTKHRGFLLAAARNMALVEKKNLNMITLCKCCFGSLKYAQHALREDPELQEYINGILKKEDLRYEGLTVVKHLLSVLHNDVGLERIKEKVVKPWEGLKVATHYGCHVLRPSAVTQFDDPITPTLFDVLVEVTGAESICWDAKLQCCGAPLMGSNDDLSTDITKKKLADARKVKAELLCNACPYCHLQFEAIQKNEFSNQTKNYYLPSILYPQLLGLSMGLDRKTLGVTKGLENLFDHLE